MKVLQIRVLLGSLEELTYIIMPENLEDKPPISIRTWVISIISLIAMLTIIVIDPFSSTDIKKDIIFPSILGLLGSSVYLLYNVLKPKKGDDYTIDPETAWNEIIAKLIMGLIAGWLSYTILKDINDDFETNKLFAWLPFLVGFSTDLFIGILNQMIISIKLTLGISQNKKLADENRMLRGELEQRRQS